MATVSESTPRWILVFDDLIEGGNDLRFQVSAGDLDIDNGFLHFDAPFVVDLHVSRSLETYTLKGRISGTSLGECCRCLASAQAAFSASWRLFVQRKETSAEEMEAIADEEGVLFVDPGVKEVSLAETLRDSVSLELPMRIYCRPACKGLCARCGADLNDGDCDCTQHEVDPRWAALVQLKQGD